MSPADIVAVAFAAVTGYAVGSLPLSAWIARAAGVGAHRDEGRSPDVPGVWELAGPGWGLLALTADLSKGVLPVAVATVTWSWGAGWAAGLGALVGASWPALGRIPGGPGVAVFAGVAFALAPPAGIIAMLLALAVAGLARLTGRHGRIAAITAIAVGIGTYTLLFTAAYRDPAGLAALLALSLVALLGSVSTRRS